MNKFNYNKEWNFVIGESHNVNPKRKSLIKREILLALQILLAGLECKEYFVLKRIYSKN